MLRQAFSPSILKSEKQELCLVYILHYQPLSSKRQKIKGSKLATFFIQTVQSVAVPFENITFSTINEVTPYSPDPLAIVLHKWITMTGTLYLLLHKLSPPPLPT